MTVEQTFRADLDTARQLAIVASDIALHYFHRGVPADTKPWDHAPAVVLVEEAGGRFSDSLGGHRVDIGEGRFSNGLVHAELHALLSNRQRTTEC